MIAPVVARTISTTNKNSSPVITTPIVTGRDRTSSMPWNIQKRDDKFCVVKDDGTTEKCHDTREAAEAHRRALYANEPKAWEQDMAAVIAAVE